ncbi:response regulator [Candidatus Falkowbacteria bacterium]|nr:response regulator [Candidatus Falkowbacteria bacterium]
MQIKKILIIEDEEAMLEALVGKLVREGFNVFKAKDGEEGLAVALKERPDLILLDIIMPKMDGITMLKKLREHEWGARAEVIILTNLSDGKSVFEAAKAGVYDFLIKTGWSINDVAKKVKERLGVR